MAKIELENQEPFELDPEDAADPHIVLMSDPNMTMQEKYAKLGYPPEFFFDELENLQLRYPDLDLSDL